MIKTIEALETLGFKKLRNGSLPGTLELVVGQLRVQALQCWTPSDGPIVLIDVMYLGKTAVAHFDGAVPQELDSLDHVKAYLAHVLGKIDDPRSRRFGHIDWYCEGKALSALLPWEVELAQYNARPWCRIDRDWAKLAFLRLKGWMARLQDEDQVRFGFDGNVLWISTPLGRTVVEGRGERWTKSFAVERRVLSMPKRLLRDPVWIDVWAGTLRVEGKGVGKAIELTPETDR